MNTLKTVCIVDDDISVRKSLANLLKSAGYRALAFASGEELLASPEVASAHCVVLDLKLGGQSGLDVQHALQNRALGIPVIGMSAYWDEQALTQSRRAGALECLRKPFSDDALLDVIGKIAS